ncbi:hypothetical protein M413DRAFT_30124 [Hebeloma cylindrosporum]|uniref:Uncharacterized protein n=1 Tax=Hebeloma cylindrosporum TaxID=76867 RepID=A0A0C3C2U5_HEBCY|nr:hypothetical protein M413DRAFT_30124 [Hebeloma cylindrosporum h7]
MIAAIFNDQVDHATLEETPRRPQHWFKFVFELELDHRSGAAMMFETEMLGHPEQRVPHWKFIVASVRRLCAAIYDKVHFIPEIEEPDITKIVPTDKQHFVKAARKSAVRNGPKPGGKGEAYMDKPPENFKLE